MSSIREWANYFTDQVFHKQAESKKILKKVFKKNIKESYTAGIVKGLEMALDVTDGENRADLHILLTDAMLDFQKCDFYKVKKATIEGTIERYES